MAQKKYVDKTGLSNFLAKLREAFAAKGHTHDDRYYTETEMDSKLNAKVPTSRTVNGKALSANVSLTASDVGASASGHTHDDRYYTETEMDSKLDAKADANHTHTIDNALSSTSTNPVQNKVINSALSGKVPTSRTVNGKALSANISLSASDVGAAASSHGHDDRYYTETEMDSKLSGKVDNTDSGLNAVINKLSTGSSVPTDNDYYVSQYAGGGTTTITYHRRPMSALWSYIKGKADSTYQAKGNYAASSHTHDDRYYTETEMDSKLSGKANSSHNHSAANITSGTLSADRLPSIPVGKLEGVIDSSNLPSYVDDVLEYTAKANFPTAGETGKIYVDTTTNLTYRWSGSAYVEISPSLALGENSSTAYRGDYGAAAYKHAVTNKGTSLSSGLYKITVNSEGHVTAGTAVTKSDITALGIPASDTNTDTKVTQTLTSSNAVYPLLLAPDAQKATATTTTYFDSGVTLNPSTNTIAANISGNAATATSATSATSAASATKATTADSCTGNAATATKLATARTISLTGSITGSGSFDGSGNLSISTTTNHTHSYLPLSGGTLTGFATAQTSAAANIGFTAKNTETNKRVSLMVGSGKVNRGVYDHVKDAWMLYADSNNNVILNGNAATATKATTADSATSATKATSLSPVTTAGDGAAYTATVNGITALTVGANFIMNPHVLSTTTTPTLNVNGLGAKTIRVQLSNSSSTAVAPAQANFLGPNKPVEVVYNGSFWVAQLIRPDASTIYGTVSVAKGGTGATTAAAALANLGAMPAAQTMTTAEYNALTAKDAATLYLLTDDTEEDDVKAHVANTTVHITSGERTKWNAKCDVSSGTSAPTSDTSGDIYIKKNSNGTGIDAVYLKI